MLAFIERCGTMSWEKFLFLKFFRFGGCLWFSKNSILRVFPNVWEIKPDAAAF